MNVYDLLVLNLRSLRNVISCCAPAYLHACSLLNSAVVMLAYVPFSHMVMIRMYVMALTCHITNDCSYKLTCNYSKNKSRKVYKRISCIHFSLYPFSLFCSKLNSALSLSISSSLALSSTSYSS